MPQRRSLRWARAMRGAAAGVAAATVVAACGDGIGLEWGSGSRATAPMVNDNCRAYAERKAEQEFAIRRSGGPAVSYSRTSAYDRQVGSYDANRRQRELYNLCMQQRGYRPLEETESEGNEGK